MAIRATKEELNKEMNCNVYNNILNRAHGMNQEEFEKFCPQIIDKFGTGLKEPVPDEITNTSQSNFEPISLPTDNVSFLSTDLHESFKNMMYKKG